ncbi:MAG: DUF111 family protein [Deltaproteobacteria bacterium]|nr:DUF111 family protein [Deltaproteobacteria bacterium]
MTHHHLHLDLALGARAELIIGALLAVGAPRAAALDALDAAGLADVGLEEERVRVRGLHASAARLVIPGELEPAAVAPRRRAHAPRRGRVAQARRVSAQRSGPHAAAAEAAALPVPGTLVLPTPPPLVRGPRPVDAWRTGAPATVHELIAALASSSLPPLTKALAHKAARRLAGALGSIAGDDARLTGTAAQRALAELTVIAALVAALAPAAITASPVGIGTRVSDSDGVVAAAGWPAPSPWVLEILAGAPLIEHDAPFIVTDAVGAACAWALAHRFGARGVTGFARQGLGAALGPPEGPLARAILGPPLPLATRAGAASAAPCVVLTTSVPADEATPALLEELRAQGAFEIRVVPEVVALGARAQHGIAVSAPAAAADDASAALWRAGAVEVLQTWADRWMPARSEVTVTVGRGRTMATVRVDVTSSAGRVVRTEPLLDDVRSAARRARRGEHAIAAEAAEAASRLVGAAQGKAGEGDDQGDEDGEDGERDDDGR